jgi:hypothetical protein
VYDSLRDLEQDYRSDAKDYLQQFFSTITKDNSVRKTFVTGCSAKSLM